jgi:hypothetical protein
MKTKYQVWNNGKLVAAYKRKPKNTKVIDIRNARTIDEKKKGIKYIQA